jgi:hypothetical protein
MVCIVQRVGSAREDVACSASRAGGRRVIMSAQVKKLAERFESLKKDGLMDVKFIFGPLTEATLDDVCASINEALDAIDAEAYVEFPLLGDSCRPAA